MSRLTVCVHGWATDARIFRAAPTDALCFSPDALSAWQLPAGARLHLVGVSLGGYAAASFAARHAAQIGQLVLVGMRDRYPAAMLAAARAAFDRSPRAYLDRFYRACFGPADGEAQAWFTQHLRAEYLATGVEALRSGLDLLAEQRLAPAVLRQFPVRFVHGGDDRIAPATELAAFSTVLPRSELVIIAGSGHLSVLRPELAGLLYA